MLYNALSELQTAPQTDEPVTLFDIALLGGLHPRTFAIENEARKERTDHGFDRVSERKMAHESIVNDIAIAMKAKKAGLIAEFGLAPEQVEKITAVLFAAGTEPGSEEFAHKKLKNTYNADAFFRSVHELF